MREISQAIDNIDASVLIPGRYYAICVDLDGAKQTLAFGDSGLIVYVSAVTNINPKAIKKATFQTIQFTCAHCNPIRETAAYLSTVCDPEVNVNGNTPIAAGLAGENSEAVFLTGPVVAQVPPPPQNLCVVFKQRSESPQISALLRKTCANNAEKQLKKPAHIISQAGTLFETPRAATSRAAPLWGGSRARLAEALARRLELRPTLRMCVVLEHCLRMILKSPSRLVRSFERPVQFFEVIRDPRVIVEYPCAMFK